MIKLIVPVEAIEKSKAQDVTIDVTDHYRLAEAATDAVGVLDRWCHDELTALSRKLKDALMGSPDDPTREVVMTRSDFPAPDDPAPVVPLVDVLAMAEDAEDAGNDGLAGDLYLALMGELRRRVEDLIGPDSVAATS
jgi:hypothetical protein